MIKITQIVIILLLLNSCSGSRKKVKESWPVIMQKAGAMVKDLLPYVYNDNAFRSPGNREKIQKKINGFAATVHKMDKNIAKKTPG